jgi:predicted Zn-ribbon and HTH transcriptional regulator
MLAHAYQREVEEREGHLDQKEEDGDDEGDNLRTPSDVSTEDVSTAEEATTVECQCKNCGHVFAVLDPYNFRCGHCQSKYTSLPTHMIADPLQCIGCRVVFPHKPSLKAHQTSAKEDRERPFRCCKCGYGFRQKAHLQKHQWRIHRRKLEPENDLRGQFPPGGVATITLQDIIDRGVEHSMRRVTDGGDCSPLDLSPPAKQPSSVAADLKDLVASLPAFVPREATSDLRIIREANPLLNLRPVATAAPLQHKYPVVHKKQRTSQEDAAATTTTWLTAAARKFSPQQVVTVARKQQADGRPPTAADLVRSALLGGSEQTDAVGSKNLRTV